jgi:hypothetical protein
MRREKERENSAVLVGDSRRATDTEHFQVSENKLNPEIVSNLSCCCERITKKKQKTTKSEIGFGGQYTYLYSSCSGA